MIFLPQIKNPYDFALKKMYNLTKEKTWSYVMKIFLNDLVKIAIIIFYFTLYYLLVFVAM